jgi:hypothetical protein
MLLVGIVTTGLSYTHAIGVTNAVREGARFGATTDASAAAPADWGTDVIAQVRATQFDDLGTPPTTAICVELFKQGTGAIESACNQGDGSVQPALSMPAFDVYPAVPAALTAGQCVVRVVAARNFTINTVIAPAWDKTILRGSVARYERDSCS